MDKMITKQNHENRAQGISLALWYVCTNGLYNFCSQMTYEVTFFVPCFNEQDNILSTLSTIQKAIQDFDFKFEIMLVSDGSTDATISLAFGHDIRNLKNCAFELFDEKQNKESIFDDIDVKVGISGSLGNLSRIDGNGLIFSNNSLIGFVVFVFGFDDVFVLSAIVLSAN